MAKESRVLKVLLVAEEVLLTFDNYFSKHPWLAKTANLSPRQFQNSLYYLVKKRLLNQDFSVTRSAKNALSLIKHDWDGYWRVVTYDIPEKNRKFRDSTKRALYQLGFAKLQRSVWLSPLPVDTWVRKLAEEYQLINFAFFTAKMLDKDPKKIVAALWPVSDWQRKAKSLINQIKKSRQMTKEIKDRFWDLVLDHPKVPLDLLPFDWSLKELALTFSRKNRVKLS